MSKVLNQLRAHQRAVEYIRTEAITDIIDRAFINNGVTGLVGATGELTDLLYLADGSLTIQLDNVVTMSEDVDEEELGRIFININDEVVKGLW